MKFSINRWSKLAGLKSINENKNLVQGYAVGQFDFNEEKTIVLYDPKLMKKAIEELIDSTKDAKKISVGKMPAAIMGMIRISPPVYGPSGDENSCRGAWEVIRSGVRKEGEGIGRILYSLAAAASPSGKIMPDRREVSPKARNVWKSRFEKMSNTSKKSNVLDDESDAKTPDPNDDCMVHQYNEEPGSNFLNYAFDNFEKIDLESLKGAHQDFIEEMSWSLPDQIDLNKLFYKASTDAFHEIS